jgi:hypothetical protein
MMSLAETLAAIAACGTDWQRMRAVVESAMDSGAFTQQQIDRILRAMPRVAPSPIPLDPPAKPAGGGRGSPRLGKMRSWRAA